MAPAVKRLLPPIAPSGARSSISTLAPFSAAASAAQNAALPAPTTTTSNFATSLPPRNSVPSMRRLARDCPRFVTFHRTSASAASRRGPDGHAVIYFGGRNHLWRVLHVSLGFATETRLSSCLVWIVVFALVASAAAWRQCTGLQLAEAAAARIAQGPESITRRPPATASHDHQRCTVNPVRTVRRRTPVADDHGCHEVLFRCAWWPSRCCPPPTMPWC